MEAPFPDEVASVLTEAGWFPGRRRLNRAESWAATLSGYTSPEGHRHAVFPAAIEAWAEYADITVDVDGAGVDVARTPFAIDPLAGLHQPRTLGDLGRALDLPVCPLGHEREGQALLVVDASGRVFSLDHAGEWFLGESLPAALTTLICGYAPARLS